MKPYLFSFTLGVGDEFPIAYMLVYAENEPLALEALKKHYSTKLYNIEYCTI